MIYLDSKTLHRIMETTLVERGVNTGSVQHVVESLIQTSLRGVDSHGIKLFPHYCRAIDGGRISKHPKITIEDTGVSTAVVDADNSFGHHSGAVAMDHAISLSKQTGIGAVSVKNSTHFGAAAYFGFRAANADCIGLAFTNANALLKTFGSNEAFFGTNPICFAAPMMSEGPFCLDMATSLASWNKIMNKQKENATIADNWAFGENGEKVTNPHEARTLNPIGEYKGYGLAMMVDILCGILADSLSSKDICDMYNAPISEKRYISHFFMAIDINKFLNTETFKRKLQDTVIRLRNLPPSDSERQVMVPGDPEKKFFQIRIKEGIPLDDEKFREFLNLSGRFSDAKVM